MPLVEQEVVLGIELLEGTSFSRGLLSSSKLLIGDVLSAFRDKGFYGAAKQAVQSAVEDGATVAARLERAGAFPENSYVMHQLESSPRQIAEFEGFGHPSRLEVAPFLNYSDIPADWSAYVADGQYSGRYVLPNMKVIQNPGLGRLSAMSGSFVRAENEAGLAPFFFKDLPISGNPTAISTHCMNSIREHSFTFGQAAALELKSSLSLPGERVFTGGYSGVSEASATARSMLNPLLHADAELLSRGQTLPQLKLRFTDMTIADDTGMIKFFHPDGLLDTPIVSEVKVAAPNTARVRGRTLDGDLFIDGKYHGDSRVPTTLIDRLDGAKARASAQINPRFLKIDASGEQVWKI